MNRPPIEASSAAAEAVVPSRADSTPAARAFLSRLLDGWGIGREVIEDAALLTTELVSNAIRHGDGTVTLRVEVEGGVVEVRVYDEAAEMPTIEEQPDATRVSGRGLFIVQCVADEWGSDQGDPGKTVWFRLGAAR